MPVEEKDIEYARFRAYGWEGTLKRHNEDRNNYRLSPGVRQAADKAHKKIVAQLDDKTLMALRERLMRATRAHDEKAVSRITKQMRDYLGQDTETGTYE